MKAIDFIRQREANEIPSLLRLWKEHKVLGEDIW